MDTFPTREARPGVRTDISKALMHSEDIDRVLAKGFTWTRQASRMIIQNLQQEPKSPLFGILLVVWGSR